MMYQPTNLDLMKRLEMMEARLDNIETMVQRANGAWMLTKWAAATVVALAALISYVKDWWPK